MELVVALSFPFFLHTWLVNWMNTCQASCLDLSFVKKILMINKKKGGFVSCISCTSWHHSRNNFVQRPKLLRSRTNYQAINADTLRAQNMESWPFFNQVKEIIGIWFLSIPFSFHSFFFVFYKEQISYIYPTLSTILSERTSTASVFCVFLENYTLSLHK